MAKEDDEYIREAVKEAIDIDKNKVDLETTASICTMIQGTLHKEASKFTNVLEQLTKTYKNEFVMGEFSVCLAISDSTHDKPIISVVTGSVPGTIKNLLYLNKAFKEIMHDKETD